MGVSTDAILCFGIAFEQDTEFPWGHGSDMEHQIDEWWLKLHNYEPPFELFDKHGNYLNGVKPPQEKINEYFDHRRAFLNEHPRPFDFVQHCHSDHPMYILTVPDTERRASRGYPTEIFPERLYVEKSEVQALADICKAHGIEGGSHPGWWLVSNWSS